MEFQVRHVGGIQNCFVSLPIQLIQTLEATVPPNSPLPNPLILELRPATAHLRHPWTVSWSGATSSSSIEIAAHFAECISIPDGEVVRVRAFPNVEKAELVTIEPVSADDWEVMENMSVLAEAVMLQQVRVVHETMRFPLWLHGHSITTFVVVSILPKNSVVQLVPQSEVAVAPKRRKREDNGQYTSRVSVDEQYIAKALLRVQDSDGRMFCNADVKGFDLSVELTSVAYVHPDTAGIFSLAALQLVVVVPRFPPKETENGASTVTSTSTLKEYRDKSLDGRSGSHNTILRLLFSSSVAKGHLMISQSIRLHLRAGVHTWVYVKGYSAEVRENFSILSLSPCHMKSRGRDKAPDKYGVELLDDRHPRDMASRSNSVSCRETGNSFIHDEVVAALSHEPPNLTNENGLNQLANRIGLARLFRAWFLAQLNSISSVPEGKASSLILGKETLLNFKVDRDRFWSYKKSKTEILPESTHSVEHTDKPSSAFLEFSYLLTISDASGNNGKFHVYNIGFDENKDSIEDGTILAKLKLGDPVSVFSQEDRASVSSFASDLSSLSWMGEAASDVINRAMVLLSPELGTCLNNCNLPLPGHVVIHGPHGSGKTILAQAVAKSLEKCDDLLAHTVYVSCSGLAVEKQSNIRQTISGYISEALDHAPSLIILDDIDSILSSASASDGSQPSNEDAALAKFFTGLLDEYAEKRNSSCGFGPVAFIATVQTLESIPQPLTSSGRFDFHVQLPAPAASERGAILKHEITRRSLECSDDILFDVASKCDGYDAYDLEILVDRTVHAAIGRFLPSDSCSERHEVPQLNRDDFSRAMNEFVPVAMRDVTKSAPNGGRSGWEDVGGLAGIRNAIKEMIQLPSRFPEIFAQSPLRLRSNVLLYGPPGCGKTHIVGAAAAGCSLRFISVKGPELLNKYIGASEQAVRDIFSKAAAAAPCILFFDEFDSIAPKRGHDNTGVTDRVVNQFLTELDGVEVLTGVFVFAATSRPDLLDAALLRPGRLDRLLFCDFPSPQERLDILTVLSRKLPLASDIDLESIAYVTEGFSGADLQALLSDAQLAAVHEHLNSTDVNKAENMPVITDTLLKSVASKARPSISDAEKQRLYGIYGQFLDSKRSVAAQSRDAKGKRATLA